MATNPNHYPMAALNHRSSGSDLYLAIDPGSATELYGKVDP
jgi:hypothetical protein